MLIVRGCFRSYCGRKVVVAADLELEDDPQCHVYALQFVRREVSGALAEAFGVDGRGLLSQHPGRSAGDHDLRTEARRPSRGRRGATSQVDSGNESDWDDDREAGPSLFVATAAAR